jgi:hypothetical protein
MHLPTEKDNKTTFVVNTKNPLIAVLNIKSLPVVIRNERSRSFFSRLSTLVATMDIIKYPEAIKP